MEDKDIYYMKEALIEAQKAYVIGDVPIGAIIVYEDRIIARAYNRRNADKLVLSHAEILAIKKASKYIGDWRLEATTIYSSLEPCPMCAGAIVQARIKRLVYAAPSLKAGSISTIINILDQDKFNHKVEVTSGVLEDESSKLLKKFFKELRK